MECFSFTNFHFQMGVTVMGFAEHFGLLGTEFMIRTVNVQQIMQYQYDYFMSCLQYYCSTTRQKLAGSLRKNPIIMYSKNYIP